LKHALFIGKIAPIGKAAKKLILRWERLFFFSCFSIVRHGNVLAKKQTHALIFLKTLIFLLSFFRQYIFYFFL